MINHHNRNPYNALIAKLQTISVDHDVAPDARRLARYHYQQLIVAMQGERTVKSDASYRNLYGRHAEARKAADVEAMETARRTAMNSAQSKAQRFLSGWGL